MSFFEDFAEGLKDVGTSATRIITDTAIDIGDVATGFQFSDDMAKAKQQMSDVGLLSAADTIEKNHYPFLKTMERQSREKVEKVNRLFSQGKEEEANIQMQINTLADMCADVALLSAESLEAQKLLEDAKRIPNWKKWATILDIPPASLAEVDAVSAMTAKWERVGNGLVTSNLVVGVSDGAAALVAIGALSKSRKLTKLAKIGQTSAKSGLKAGTNVAKVMAKASKFMKIGKLAGRASGALAVVTVGLDIGMSVAELEIKKSSLEETLKNLDEGIAEAQESLNDLKAENRGIQSHIGSLLNSVAPPQSRQGWNKWVEETREQLRSVTEKLISVTGIIALAEQKAIQTRGLSTDLRVQYVAAIDPAISEEEAAEIITSIDRRTGVADPDAKSNEHLSKICELAWRVDGPEGSSISSAEGLDMMTLTYSFGALDKQPHWTFFATAPWTRTLQFRWAYGASHNPKDLTGKLIAFSDGPSGREFTSFFSATPNPVNDPVKGTTTLQIHKGQVFGFTISANPSVFENAIAELCATYRREPVENDWHTGVIDVQDEMGTVLKWTNQAGVSWDLLPHLKAGLLLKTAGSPYQDAHPGSNEFVIIRDGDAVSGFEFMGETYVIDPSSRKSNPSTARSTGLNIGSIEIEFSD